MPHKLRNVRVLVVSPNGLVAIYYPNANYNDKNEETTTTRTTTTTTTTSTPSSTASPPSSSLSKDSPTFEELDLSSRMLQVDDERGNKDNDMNNNNHRPGHDHDDEQVKVEVEQAEEDTWELRKVSLIHQKSLVIAELTWNPVKVSEDQEYLITWELDGGGLKGHLVTDSTSVSLSLWPDTLYHIQVRESIYIFSLSFSTQRLGIPVLENLVKFSIGKFAVIHILLAKPFESLRDMQADREKFSVNFWEKLSM